MARHFKRQFHTLATATGNSYTHWRHLANIILSVYGSSIPWASRQGLYSMSKKEVTKNICLHNMRIKRRVTREEWKHSLSITVCQKITWAKKRGRTLLLHISNSSIYSLFRRRGGAGQVNREATLCGDRSMNVRVFATVVCPRATLCGDRACQVLKRMGVCMFFCGQPSAEIVLRWKVYKRIISKNRVFTKMRCKGKRKTLRSGC